MLKDLPERTKDVLKRRFGLKTSQRATLETIGKNYGITRERVRQIETDGLSKLKAKTAQCQEPFQYLLDLLKGSGDLRREDSLFDLAGPAKFQNHIFFLLSLGQDFERYSETEDLYSLWALDNNSLNFAQDFINTFIEEFEQGEKLLSSKEIISLRKDLPSQALFSYLEISKKIKQGTGGLFGLKDWPEISPRGVKDRAYLVLKEQNRPLHFTEVASLIDKMEERGEKKTLARTAHNELIKDPRFVLVGRGLYALKERGYEPGQVKDVILKILKQAKKPLPKQEIVEKVLEQRFVKPNTILLNLNNKQYFSRDSQGRYHGNI